MLFDFVSIFLKMPRGAIPMEKKPGKLENGEEEGPVTMAKNITLVRGTCIIVSTIIGTGNFPFSDGFRKNFLGISD